MDALNILAYAIKREEEGERFYQENLGRISSKATRDILEALVEMEKEHGDLLRRRYETLDKTGQWLPVEEDIKGVEFFKIRFEAEHGKQTDREAAVSDISILRMAYLIENDLAEFYKKAADNIDNPEGKKLFQALSEWEVEHKDALYKVYQEHFHDSWFDAGFSPF